MSNQNILGDGGRLFAKQLLNTYFKTFSYPFTSHHISSYDQFLSEALPSIIQSHNPILILKDLISDSPDPKYRYKTEIYVGGQDGKGIYIGTPSIALQDTEEVRLLFPNECRLRNLSYRSTVLVDMFIKVTIMLPDESGKLVETLLPPIKFENSGGIDERIPLFKIPIMLQSRYCVLHNKPAEFLREAGESEYDYGGYFIIDGAEKVLITTQEQAFNTLYILNQDHDPKITQYASITCLSPRTRQVKRVIFTVNRQTETLQVMLPFVRKEIPIFLLFRAMGLQSDRDIINVIFPDPDSAEAKILTPLLLPSIHEAHPFTDTHLAVQYIRFMTKGFSEAHVLDILHNQLFIHVEDLPGARVAFLGECIRSILRVKAGIDLQTNRDDTRTQRCLSSGFLTQMLFQNIYAMWVKKMQLAFDREYAWKIPNYKGSKFVDILAPSNHAKIFEINLITDALMRAFKGKWGSGFGEEKQGVVQALSRLSYHDFLSHCRRVVLDFDTGLKLPGPRKLNPSQYGYFCTSETPTGASIGITKNFSIMTLVSTGTDPAGISSWLLEKGKVIACAYVNVDSRKAAVPVYVNGGILGYTGNPQLLVKVLKMMKWTGCLPALCSIGFSIRDRKVFLYLDEGRPLRPLIHLGESGKVPMERMANFKRWRDYVMGDYEKTKGRDIMTSGFIDPLVEKKNATLEEYLAELTPHTGTIEYVDPYEQNESFISNFAEQIGPTTSHLEVHPSTIVGLMTSMIPFPQHNQSPRNQLSCSQSKQGLSVYSTNYKSRFDNQVHVLCYPEAPLCRTMYFDYVADGKIGYGSNLVLAIGCFTGYNQEDGIVINKDAVLRGLFRNMSFRSYETFEENSEKDDTETRIANPTRIPAWTELANGLDYSKLDDRGIVKVGSYVDDETVIVGRYVKTKSGQYKDLSLKPQAWTRGRVEEVVITVNNFGLRLVKVRVVQDRTPELGDKLSNRHGQKGTIGMLINGVDMPRTAEGIVPDMIMNPHAIPSRMTIAQLLETIFGKAASQLGAIANGTAFMTDGDPSEAIGDVLEKELGIERYGNEILYDGTTGVQIPSVIFIGQCYTMRLKHMVEDKWNARGEGRREQRTHQPTGGRGNEGGLRIGEMEANAIIGHGTSSFLRESYIKRSDGTQFYVCNGCGTIPIYNEKEAFFVCPLCDGPVEYTGSTVNTFELLPPNKRSLTTFSKVEMPYVMKLLDQELSTYMNIGMRFLTTKNVEKLQSPEIMDIEDQMILQYKNTVLEEIKEEEVSVPAIREAPEEVNIETTDLRPLGATAIMTKKEGNDDNVPLAEDEDTLLEKQIVSTRPTTSILRTNAPAFVPRAQPQIQTQTQPQPKPQPATLAQALPSAIFGAPRKQGNALLYPLAFNAPLPAGVYTGPEGQLLYPGTIDESGESKPIELFRTNEGLLQPLSSAPNSPVIAPVMEQKPKTQVQIIQTVPVQDTTVLGTALPGGPQQIYVDTSPDAMVESGLAPFSLTAPQIPSSSSNMGSAANRNRTRRAARPSNGPGIFNRLASSAQQASSPMANAKVTVQKLGS